MNRKHAIVLGAGIQGVCAAIALHKQGYRVCLIDKMPDCLQRASLRNEGKIHLGFVYAKDHSFQTASLMLRSALSFAPLLEAWLGKSIDWENWSLFRGVFRRQVVVDANLTIRPTHRLIQADTYWIFG